VKRLPIWLFLIVLVGGLAWIAVLGTHLPARVAVHFDAAGRANGWMSRGAAVGFFAVFALVFPLVLPALLFLARFLPPRMLNVPRKDYWYRQVCAYLFASSFWVAAASVGFVVGMFVFVVLANREQPPVLASGPVLALAGLYVAAMLGWTVRLLCVFTRRDLPAGP
jgi:uncharacterized membrane protein